MRQIAVLLIITQSVFAQTDYYSVEKKLATQQMKNFKYRYAIISDIDCTEKYIFCKQVATREFKFEVFSISPYAEFEEHVNVTNTTDSFHEFCSGKFGLNARAVRLQNGEFILFNSNNSTPNSKSIFSDINYLNKCIVVRNNNFWYVLLDWVPFQRYGINKNSLVTVLVFDGQHKLIDYYSYLNEGTFEMSLGFYNKDDFLDVPYLSMMNASCYSYNLYSYNTMTNSFQLSKFNNEENEIVICK